MVTMSAPLAARQAREALLVSLHDAGVEPGSPLGVLLIRQFEITALACEQLTEATATAETLLDRSRKELGELRESLAQGLVQVREMGEVARTSLCKQEEFRKTEIETSLTRIVDGLTATLREEVFLKLREQIPLHERAFFREMRFRAYTRIAMAAFFLSLLGFIGGYSYNWDAARVGSYCKKHEMNDPHDGMEWCALSPPTMTKGGSEEGNASGGDARTQ
ncbi:hypothetical protein GCM10010937_17660 [Gluconobacter japonicus]|uniref:Uncharacterized protein n=2 Tax=Gluconobacter japonicus TaxID=376620 RepID=A0ABQ5WJT2_GLUJA|nr:hypothetical protein AA3271_2067 [Gluconobacter japonicus NBRC 3271]GLQ59963.1 hypothetical protein GCM10010937_17660 [Gluconobacter japonicus]